ncbi:MAG: A/G-specific adenine glycosylase [Bryobacteraceae bacterium]
MLTQIEIELFRSQFLDWFAQHKRDLPWRRTRDPYAIWISEVMLQQTRVSAVIPYYERFVSRFPELQSLAQASEPDLLAHWAGLGYYYRARNLQKAARQALANGGFPASYEAIRELPGIGEYTAAAVASIAFNLPHPVVDGNVYRVLSRVFSDRTNIASTGARKHFTALAESILDHSRPGDFNQAVMELGATVCLPKRPLCLVCPVSGLCKARQAGTQGALPVKIKARQSVDETRILLWIAKDDKVLLWQRPPSARLMPGFWELPEPEHIPRAQIGTMLGRFQHGITFHNYRFEVHAASVVALPGNCEWIATSEFSKLPISTALKKAHKLVKAVQSQSAVGFAKNAAPNR